MKSKEVQALLDAIPRQTVGGGAKRNLFVVTRKGSVVMLTYDGPAAYRCWHNLLLNEPHVESALEDNHGCVATREPEEDNSSRLVAINDAPQKIRTFL